MYVCPITESSQIIGFRALLTPLFEGVYRQYWDPINPMDVRVPDISGILEFENAPKN